MERGALCSSLSEDAWSMTRLMLKTVSRALTMSTLARQTSSCLLSRSRYCAAPPLIARSTGKLEGREAMPSYREAGKCRDGSHTKTEDEKGGSSGCES